MKRVVRRAGPWRFQLRSGRETAEAIVEEIVEGSITGPDRRAPRKSSVFFCAQLSDSESSGPRPHLLNREAVPQQSQEFASSRESRRFYGILILRGEENRDSEITGC